MAFFLQEDLFKKPYGMDAKGKVGVYYSVYLLYWYKSTNTYI